MTDDLDPAVYERAADVLDRDGWIQGRMRSALGYCVIGAIAELQPGLASGVRHVAYLKQLLGLESNTNIARWNDAPGRTKDEVVDLFRTAADKLRAEQGTMLDGPA